MRKLAFSVLAISALIVSVQSQEPQGKTQWTVAKIKAAKMSAKRLEATLNGKTIKDILAILGKPEWVSFRDEFIGQGEAVVIQHSLYWDYSDLVWSLDNEVYQPAKIVFDAESGEVISVRKEPGRRKVEVPR